MDDSFFTWLYLALAAGLPATLIIVLALKTKDVVKVVWILILPVAYVLGMMLELLFAAAFGFGLGSDHLFLGSFGLYICGPIIAIVIAVIFLVYYWRRGWKPGILG